MGTELEGVVNKGAVVIAVNQTVQETEYAVVFRNEFNQVTWSVFENKASFDEYFSGNMMDGSNKPLKDVYAIVAEGITDDEAVMITSARREVVDVLIRQNERLNNRGGMSREV